MSPIARRIAGAVHRNGPGRGLCFACLAAQERVKEHDVRAVALVLMVRAALEVVHRACSSCRGIGEVLVAQRAA
jgi:hypothetical protein